MNNNYKNLLLSITSLASLSAFAQISDGGTPYSFNATGLHKSIAPEIAPALDFTAIDEEDLANSAKDIPYRVGMNIPMDLTMDNSGVWENTFDGGRIWRLSVKSNGALALSFYLDHMVIPDGAVVFIYNKGKNHIIGSFGSDRKGNREILATQMLQGDEVIIEYKETSNVSGTPNIDIKEVVHYYRGVEDFVAPFYEEATGNVLNTKADPCQVDVACSPENNGKDDQINGTVHYSFPTGGGTSVCSGAMVNNTANDLTPYLLSAWHCGEPSAGQTMSGYVWYWNYQKASCSPGNSNSTDPGRGNQSMGSGSCVASSENGNLNNPNANQVAGSDFFLVELNSMPPAAYNAFYCGWDKSGDANTGGYGIHHPAGSAKKISTYTQTLASTTYNGGASQAHWSVKWVSTTNGHGVTEGGSSGSPIFDNNGRILGQLSGGSSYCTFTNGSDLYGKFSVNWDQSGSNSNAQLEPWLDPNGTGEDAIDGIYRPGAPASIEKLTANQKVSVYPNPSLGIFDLSIQLEQTSNAELIIIDALGKRVRTSNLGEVFNSTFNIDISDLPNGVYFVKVNTYLGSTIKRVSLNK